MREIPFDPIVAFGALAGSIIVALKDRELPPLKERWVQSDRIHVFYLQSEAGEGHLRIRDSELPRFGHESPEQLDEALILDGFKPEMQRVRLVGDRFFRSYFRRSKSDNLQGSVSN